MAEYTKEKETDCKPSKETEPEANNGVLKTGDKDSGPAPSCCGCGGINLSQSSDAETVQPVILPWWRLGIALVVAGQSMVFGIGINLTPPEFGSTAYIVLHSLLAVSALAILALLGPALFRNWLQGLWKGKITVEGLFALSGLGALVASFVCSFTATGDVYYEVVAIVLVIYTVGKKLGEESRRHVFNAVDQWGDRFAKARRISCCGSQEWVDAEAIESGDTVLVQPGEAISVDGEILEGSAFIYETALNGETEPSPKGPGESVFAGSFSSDGSLKIKATRSGLSREIDRTLDFLRSGPSEPPSSFEREADRAIQIFLPSVILVAALVFVGWTIGRGWEAGLFNSMAVLLVACPCAFGLATPLALWTGLRKLFDLGIASRSPRLLHALANTRHCFIDKTGTLTESEFQEVALQMSSSSPFSENVLRGLLHQIEEGQTHPLAKSLRRLAAASENAPPPFDGTVREIKNLPGVGLTAKLESREHGLAQFDLINSAAWEGSIADLQPTPAHCRRTLIVWNDQVIGAIDYAEAARERSMDTLQRLREIGCEVTIVTGDPNPDLNAWGEITLHSGLTPEAKARFLKQSFDKGQMPIMVGDAANDTPAFVAAAGALAFREGAALAGATAQGQIAGTHLANLPTAIEASRKTAKNLRQNRSFSLFYNIVGVTLAAAGILHPVVAALLMLGSSAFVSARAWQGGS